MVSALSPARRRRVSRLRAPRPPLVALPPQLDERALAIQVDDEPRHLAAADVEQARCLRPYLPELQSALLAAPAEAPEHENTLAIELAVLVRLKAVLLPGASELAPALCHPAQPRPTGGHGPVCHHPFDPRVRPLDRTKVTPFPAREDRPHEVHVCGGHDRSIPCRTRGC